MKDARTVYGGLRSNVEIFIGVHCLWSRVASTPDALSNLKTIERTLVERRRARTM